MTQLEKKDPPLKHTPLFASHEALKARMVPFAGFLMPLQYTSALKEAKITRDSCGLFDVSHMGQISLRGKKALEELTKLVTNDPRRLKQNQAQYSLMCQSEGGTLDDLIIYKRAEDWLYLCVNAVNKDKDLAWIKDHISPAVDVEDESDETGLIALQGPNAESILQNLIYKNFLTLSNVAYYTGSMATLCGKEVFVSRTGYTGEDGFEIYAPAKDTVALWEELLTHTVEKGGAPCGLASRDILRIEMGYPLYGHEIRENEIPFSLGLDWVIKPREDIPFIGQAPLLGLSTKSAKLPPRLQGVLLSTRRIAREGSQVFDADGSVIARITSGTWSPNLNQSIALCLWNNVPSANTDLSTGSSHLVIEVHNERTDATVAPLPFFPSHVKRNTPQKAKKVGQALSK